MSETPVTAHFPFAVDDRCPISGNEFTKSGDHAIPEYVASGATMLEGAEMGEILDDGTQRLVAVFDHY